MKHTCPKPTQTTAVERLLSGPMPEFHTIQATNLTLPVKRIHQCRWNKGSRKKTHHHHSRPCYKAAATTLALPHSTPCPPKVAPAGRGNVNYNVDERLLLLMKKCQAHSKTNRKLKRMKGDHRVNMYLYTPPPLF